MCTFTALFMGNAEKADSVGSHGQQVRRETGIRDARYDRALKCAGLNVFEAIQQNRLGIRAQALAETRTSQS